MSQWSQYSSRGGDKSAGGLSECSCWSFLGIVGLWYSSGFSCLMLGDDLGHGAVCEVLFRGIVLAPSLRRPLKGYPASYSPPGSLIGRATPCKHEMRLAALRWRQV